MNGEYFRKRDMKASMFIYSALLRKRRLAANISSRAASFSLLFLGLPCGSGDMPNKFDCVSMIPVPPSMIVSRCNKKGHRHIVLARGPARPVSNTQAVPHIGTLTFLRLLTLKFAGFGQNTKSSVLNTIKLSSSIIDLASMQSN